MQLSRLLVLQLLLNWKGLLKNFPGGGNMAPDPLSLGHVCLHMHHHWYSPPNFKYLPPSQCHIKKVDTDSFVSVQMTVN